MRHRATRKYVPWYERALGDMFIINVNNLSEVNVRKEIINTTAFFDTANDFSRRQNDYDGISKSLQ